MLLLSESTGVFESRMGRAIAALLREVAHSEGIAMLIATHDATIAASADHVLQLHDGLLSGA